MFLATSFHEVNPLTFLPTCSLNLTSELSLPLDPVSASSYFAVINSGLLTLIMQLLLIYFLYARIKLLSKHCPTFWTGTDSTEEFPYILFPQQPSITRRGDRKYSGHSTSLSWGRDAQCNPQPLEKSSASTEHQKVLTYLIFKHGQIHTRSLSLKKHQKLSLNLQPLLWQVWRSSSPLEETKKTCEFFFHLSEWTSGKGFQLKFSIDTWGEKANKQTKKPTQEYI